MALTKAQSVMELPLCHQCDTDPVVFSNMADDNDERSVIFPRSMWEEFGRPEFVTVTIEPGDKLNG